MRTLTLPALACTALVACFSGNEDPPAIDAGHDSGKADAAPELPFREVARHQNVENRDLDLLFVIDNSGSMRQEQDALAVGFNGFLNALEALVGYRPNLHVGVVSTDMGAGPYGIMGCEGNGDGGVLLASPTSECVPPSGAFISDVEGPGGSRVTNYSGSFADTFSCIARLGTDGCGFEQTLKSMRKALDGSNPQNAGFLREDANLAVLFLTDEDDCSAFDISMFDSSPEQDKIDSPLGFLTSFRCFEFGVVCDLDAPRQTGPKANCRPRDDSEYMEPVSSYVDFLLSLKSDPSKIVVSALAGDASPVAVGLSNQDQPTLEPVCIGEDGEADPAVRLGALIDALGPNSSQDSICSSTSLGLAPLAEAIAASLNAQPCVAGEISDLDEGTDGLQYECRAELVEGGASTELAECDPGSSDDGPCYALDDSPTCSSTPSGLSLRLAGIPASADEVVLSCR
jgi:hypothetical protein